MICAIGELLIDFVQCEENEFGFPILSAVPGGAPANFLTAVKKQGTDAAFIGKVGDDAFGNKLTETLKEKGINVKGIIKSPDVFTTLAFVTLSKTGDRSFSFARKPGADTKLTYEEIDLSIIDCCTILHFGSLSFTDEPSRESVLKTLKYAKNKGKIISYDPNYRPSLWKDEKKARNNMLKGFEYADIVKLSDDEAGFIFGKNPEETADILMNTFDCSLVFVTLGEKGCYCKNKNGCFYTKSEKDVTPVDTTGAGDIFTGTAEALILQSGKHPDGLSNEELKKITAKACTTATLSTLYHGGMR